MQEIIYPNDLKMADANVALLKDQFKTGVNGGPPETLLNYLERLSDILKNSLAKALLENPERCKRELVGIRQEALQWYLLDNIENSRCNIELYRLKNELKWYIDETERIYNSIEPMNTNKGRNLDANFYSDIVHKLYVWNTKIDNTTFRDPYDFIEAKHNEAPFPGKVFYENIMHAMPNHFGATMRNEFFKEVLNYCVAKIQELTKGQTPGLQTVSETSPQSNPVNFKDVFATEGWEKYIIALQKTEPPLINQSFEFIGNAKKHKGVICAWIKALQYKGIIKQTVSRTQLVFVLNSELKNFNLGKAGKTLDNISKVYDNDFRKQLEAIIK